MNINYRICCSRILSSLQMCQRCPLLGNKEKKRAGLKVDVFFALEDILTGIEDAIHRSKKREEVRIYEGLADFVILLRETCYECTGSMSRIREIYVDRKEAILNVKERKLKIAKREPGSRVVVLAQRAKEADIQTE